MCRNLSLTFPRVSSGARLEIGSEFEGRLVIGSEFEGRVLALGFNLLCLGFGRSFNGIGFDFMCSSWGSIVCF